jgi:hypothetical protein
MQEGKHLSSFTGSIGLFCVWLLLSGGCASPGPESDWDPFVERFLESHFAANPAFAVHQGRHEFDGRLPDWSGEGLRAEIERLQGFAAEARRFEPSALTERQRFEREYLLAVLEGELFWLERARAPWRNPIYYSWALDPNVYLSRPYAPLGDRMAAFTRWASNVPDACGRIRANLETPLPRTFVDLGMQVFGGLAEFLEADVPAVFADVEDASLQSQFETARSAAVQALKGLEEWFREQQEGAGEGFALGTDLFLEMLRSTERVDLSLEQLEAAGRLDLERNQQLLEEACGRFMPRHSIVECVQEAQTRKPEEGAIEAARRQLQELEQFLRSADLVSVPGQEQALVEEAPPHQRWNFAYIEIPGPYEEGLPSVYYIAPPDPAWTTEEQAAYIPGSADLLFTSVHEVWPGHFLQFLHSNRSASRMGQVFVGYAFAEGWAHYAEELMWDAGLGRGDPEIHIGQLLNALLRNVRYLAAIGLHTGGMTVEDAERMFLIEAFQDPGTARQQAARGTFDPAYLNYTLGKLMIRKLREDWTAQRGGRDAWREFHDAFLAFGGPPIPLIREAMLGPEAGPPL